MGKLYYLFLAFVLSIPVIYFKTDIPGDIWMYGETIIEEGFTKARVEYAYDKLPQPLQDMLEENGYRIYVVDTIDDNEQILGQTIYGIRLILIKDYGAWIEKTFYHECGHVLDDESALTFASSSDEFQEIYEEERHNFKAEDNLEYYISTPREYFASAFAEYMLNPERLKRNTPRTYEYIDRQVKQQYA
jgi:hypothetical protein